VLRATSIVAGIALAVAVPGASARTLAAPVVAKRVAVEIVSNGGGNRLDVVVRISTGRPNRRCSGVAKLQGRQSQLRPLVTEAKKGGRQWHWYLGDGAKRGRLTVSVTCRFPDGKTATRVEQADVGPGPFPRRPFKHVVQPRSLRIEPWAPEAKHPGSGGSAVLYPKGQCTWWVARQRPDLPYFAGTGGDAKNWLASAQLHKLPTGLEPRVGAVAVFQPGQYGAGIYGHVAYVTSVDGSRMTVREANYGKRPAGSSRTTGWTGVRFIYTEALPAPAQQESRPFTPAPAPTPPEVPAKVLPSWPTIDLASSGNTRFAGAQGAVAGAGDVNGDGYQDVLVSDSNVTGNGGWLGSVWVVFGSPTLGGSVDLLNLGTRGFRVDGASEDDGAGVAVDGIGDVNGDGKDDIVIGASHGGSAHAGAAYVVFGKADAGTVSLGALGGQGYVISVATGEGDFGMSVAGAGDVNGDGRPDVVVGAPSANHTSSFSSGSAYVVYGKATTTPIDLAALGAAGFRIDGVESEGAGMAVAGVGDVDGDGFADIVIGAPNRYGGGSSPGRVYVVMGGNVTDPGRFLRKFTIAGSVAGEMFGDDVAGVGDVNGDGRPDIAVLALGAAYNGGGGTGAMYVVFGKKVFSGFNAAHLGSGGFRVDGSEMGISAVAGAGDVNGDGRDDLALGQPFADFSSRTDAGDAVVVFGKPDSDVIDLTSLAASAGFVIGGSVPQARAGGSVDDAGDVNGDGRNDLVVSSWGDEAQLLYGRPPPG
jgi:surface antigen